MGKTLLSYEKYKFFGGKNPFYSFLRILSRWNIIKSLPHYGLFAGLHLRHSGDLRKPFKAILEERQAPNAHSFRLQR